eukprot:COSAG03_NODE_2278_length_2923_cov_2.247521_2_plen_125_part_00
MSMQIGIPIPLTGAVECECRRPSHLAYCGIGIPVNGVETVMPAHIGSLAIVMQTLPAIASSAHKEAFKQPYRLGEEPRERQVTPPPAPTRSPAPPSASQQPPHPPRRTPPSVPGAPRGLMRCCC